MMKVDSISNLSAVPLSNLVRASNTQGSISLPVNSGQYLYSNLKHIRGIPASPGGMGYSITKLRALDNLIDRLQDLKGGESMAKTREQLSQAQEPSEIDKFTESLRTELLDVLGKRNSSFLGNRELDTGLTLDLYV